MFNELGMKHFAIACGFTFAIFFVKVSAECVLHCMKHLLAQRAVKTNLLICIHDTSLEHEKCINNIFIIHIRL